MLFLFPILLTGFVFSIDPSFACSGCGCRGGPGYRGPDGNCVSWKTIGRVCGSPPTLSCSAEGPNAGAEEAAALGALSKQSRDARKKPAAPVHSKAQRR